MPVQEGPERGLGVDAADIRQLLGGQLLEDLGSGDRQPWAVDGFTSPWRPRIR
jgi:hypothetical protein